MKKLSTNPIDQHFREVLKSPDLKYDKQDWKGLEKMLPQNTEKKNRTWWLPASVAAAIVLLFTSLWILNKPVTDSEITYKARIEKPKQDTENSGDLAKNTSDRDGSPELRPAMESDLPEKEPESGRKIINFENGVAGQLNVQNESIDYSIAFKGITHRPSLAAFSKLTGIQTPDSLSPGPHLMDANLNPEIQTGETERKSEVPLESQKSKFSLGISISPDLNSIGKFSEGSFGNSFGLTASYQVTPRLSVSTALAYSRKVYSALPYEYNAPWAMSNTAKYARSIDADCRVLDIPLNLQYNILKSSKRTFFASAGVSSYLMLDEKYTIDVNSNQGGYPANGNPSYGYKNENQHLLGILNLSAGLAKPLSKQTSLVIEPYARLPLTGIGQGNVHLKSVGLNLQLQYNFKKKAEREPTRVNVPQ